MNKFLLRLMPIIDVLAMPCVYPCAWLLKNIRRAGVHRLPRCRTALRHVGVFPIRNHYYEPQFVFSRSESEAARLRALPGIDMNEQGQLKLLEQFTFSEELKNLPSEKSESARFYLNNRAFESGDAEYWYQIIRAIKPARIIEVGSGNSTLMAIKAIEQNRKQDAQYTCTHTCIEPYEMPWLDQMDVEVIRKRVESIDVSFFQCLEANDILFIDSSHIIRPGGDVVFEYLQLLPSLKQGVIVHLHDIFTPRNYPDHWLEDEVRFWNEQYLLEAFLTHNRDWEILGALNYLHQFHYEALRAIAPSLRPAIDPGSFYLRKIR